MGIWDAITELVEAATPWAVAEAEAPAKEEDSKVRQLDVQSHHHMSPLENFALRLLRRRLPTDLLSDSFGSSRFQSISTHADHCHQDESAETKDDSEDAEGEDKDEGGEDGGDEEGGEGGEEEEEEEAEEEEDDEEEIVDPKETLEEGSSFALAPYLSTPERVR